MTSGIRRVILGDDADGRTRVVSDGEVPGASGRLRSVWAGPAPATLPSDGTEPGLDELFPPPGGFRFMVVDMVPEGTRPATGDQRYDGFHRSDSYDCGVVLSGEVVLGLDDGEEVVLRAGDTFVQCGGNHVWRNRSDAVCRVAFVLIGAERIGSAGRR